MIIWIMEATAPLQKVIGTLETITIMMERATPRQATPEKPTFAHHLQILKGWGTVDNIQIDTIESNIPIGIPNEDIHLAMEDICWAILNRTEFLFQH